MSLQLWFSTLNPACYVTSMQGFLTRQAMILFKSLKLTRNESNTACSICTQRCCSRMPGSVFPEQLKTITVKSICKLLRNGYCLDWWEGDPRIDLKDVLKTTQLALKALEEPEKYSAELEASSPFKGKELTQCYYIRPKIKGYENNVFHPTWGGECSFLTPTGCKHKFTQRPAECQALIPNEAEPGRCGKHTGSTDKYSKRNTAIAWIDYQDILAEAGRIVDAE